MSILDKFRKRVSGRLPVKGRNGSNKDWEFNQVLTELESNLSGDAADNAEVLMDLAALAARVTIAEAELQTAASDITTLKLKVAVLEGHHALS